MTNHVIEIIVNFSSRSANYNDLMFYLEYIEKVKQCKHKALAVVVHITHT